MAQIEFQQLFQIFIMSKNLINLVNRTKRIMHFFLRTSNFANHQLIKSYKSNNLLFYLTKN